MSETSVASPTPEEIRAELQRILESPVFSTALRLSQFLQFVVLRSIEGQATAIKEYLIGVEVYNRAPSYDPKADSIVRAEASRLRAKLREYYEASGKNDSVRIDLPKGNYTPVFRLNLAEAASLQDRPSEPPPRAKVPWQWGTAAAALILLAAVALFWGTTGGAKKVRSIAVMPPVNLGPDRTNDTLGDTLADEMTSALVDSTEWKVVGRAPVKDQTGHDQMLRWLRENLHADLLLTGSYRIGENSNMRLSMQLVNVEDGRLLWTQTYHQRVALFAEAQREWAQALVADMTHKTRATSSRKAHTPANEKARTYYAQARELWSKYTDQSLEQSLKLFQQAVQADPGFAPAWSGLADANVRLVDFALEPVVARTEAARSAAVKAIALDDSNAEAHAALGWIQAFRDWNFAEGSRHLERAVELDPIRVFPNIYYSQVLTILGDFRDAQFSVEAARARLPQIPEVVFQQGSVFFLARNYGKLEALGRELIALDPNGPLGHWLVGLSLEQRGQVPGAIAEFQSGLKQEPHNLRTLCALSHAYGLAHDNAKALQTMRLFIDPDQKEITRFTLSYCAALTYASIGQKDPAFGWLEKARIGRDASFPYLPQDPRFDVLKSDPRFQPLADSLKKPAVGDGPQH